MLERLKTPRKSFNTSLQSLVLQELSELQPNLDKDNSKNNLLRPIPSLNHSVMPRPSETTTHPVSVSSFASNSVVMVKLLVATLKTTFLKSPVL